MQIKLHAVALGLIVAGTTFAANAETPYYNPTNTAPGNDAGNTVGYQLYSTIGCPGKQLLDPGCPAEATDSKPVTATLPEPTAAPVTASVPAPEPVPVAAPAPAPAPVQIAKVTTPPISNQSNLFCNFFPMPNGSNPYLSSK